MTTTTNTMAFCLLVLLSSTTDGLLTSPLPSLNIRRSSLAGSGGNNNCRRLQVFSRQNNNQDYYPPQNDNDEQQQYGQQHHDGNSPYEQQSHKYATPNSLLSNSGVDRASSSSDTNNKAARQSYQGQEVYEYEGKSNYQNELYERLKIVLSSGYSVSDEGVGGVAAGKVGVTGGVRSNGVGVEKEASIGNDIRGGGSKLEVTHTKRSANKSGQGNNMNLFNKLDISKLHLPNLHLDLHVPDLHLNDHMAKLHLPDLHLNERLSDLHLPDLHINERLSDIHVPDINIATLSNDLSKIANVSSSILSEVIATAVESYSVRHQMRLEELARLGKGRGSVDSRQRGTMSRVGGGISGVMLPKVEAYEHVHEFDALLAREIEEALMGLDDDVLTVIEDVERSDTEGCPVGDLADGSSASREFERNLSKEIQDAIATSQVNSGRLIDDDVTELSNEFQGVFKNEYAARQSPSAGEDLYWRTLQEQLEEQSEMKRNLHQVIDVNPMDRRGNLQKNDVDSATAAATTAWESALSPDNQDDGLYFAREGKLGSGRVDDIRASAFRGSSFEDPRDFFNERRYGRPKNNAPPARGGDDIPNIYRDAPPRATPQRGNGSPDRSSSGKKEKVDYDKLFDSILEGQKNVRSGVDTSSPSPKETRPSSSPMKFVEERKPKMTKDYSERRITDIPFTRLRSGANIVGKKPKMPKGYLERRDTATYYAKLMDGLADPPTTGKLLRSRDRLMSYAPTPSKVIKPSRPQREYNPPPKFNETNKAVARIDREEDSAKMSITDEALRLARSLDLDVYDVLLDKKIGSGVKANRGSCDSEVVREEDVRDYYNKMKSRLLNNLLRMEKEKQLRVPVEDLRQRASDHDNNNIADRHRIRTRVAPSRQYDNELEELEFLKERIQRRLSASTKRYVRERSPNQHQQRQQQHRQPSHSQQPRQPTIPQQPWQSTIPQHPCQPITPRQPVIPQSPRQPSMERRPSYLQSTTDFQRGVYGGVDPNASDEKKRQGLNPPSALSQLTANMDRRAERMYENEAVRRGYRDSSPMLSVQLSQLTPSSPPLDGMHKNNPESSIPQGDFNPRMEDRLSPPTTSDPLPFQQIDTSKFREPFQSQRPHTGQRPQSFGPPNMQQKRSPFSVTANAKATSTINNESAYCTNEALVLAEKYGVDLSLVTPENPDYPIGGSDVEQYIRGNRKQKPMRSEEVDTTTQTKSSTEDEMTYDEFASYFGGTTEEDDVRKGKGH
eukprot:g4821.t1 g4821   contig18:2-3715(-)